jgi:hypothetical protein
MSPVDSTTKLPVRWMRWTARLLSVPWAVWALFWMWFILINYLNEGLIPQAVYIIIIATVFLMFVGAAVIASVWGKEAFGGGVLLLDGVLIMGFGTLAPHSPMLIERDLGGTVLLLSSCVLPPLVAGYLFLVCHRRSRTSGA